MWPFEKLDCRSEGSNAMQKNPPQGQPTGGLASLTVRQHGSHQIVRLCYGSLSASVLGQSDSGCYGRQLDWSGVMTGRKLGVSLVW